MFADVFGLHIVEIYDKLCSHPGPPPLAILIKRLNTSILDAKLPEVCASLSNLEYPVSIL